VLLSDEATANNIRQSVLNVRNATSSLSHASGKLMKIYYSFKRSYC
jgi:hypothetical protein